MQHNGPSSPLNCFCGRKYSNHIDLEEHRRARGHFASHRCNPSCQHPRAVPHDGQTYKCDGCDKICERLDILQDHLIATNHLFCRDCDISFTNEAALKNHRESGLCASEFKCCDCDIFFKDVHALVAHMESRAHRKPSQQKAAQKPQKKAARTPQKEIAQTPDMLAKTTKKVEECKECNTTFTSKKALEQHCASVKHKPLSDLSCPMGKGCRSKFTSPSALLHHLESGKCQSGMTREEMHLLVRSCDTEGVIHTQSALAPSTSSSVPIMTPSATAEPPSPALSTQSDWSLLTPAPSSPSFGPTESEWSLLTPTPSQGSLSDSLEAWTLLSESDGHLSTTTVLPTITITAFICPLCPKKKRSKFRSALALQQHMDSPAHAAKIYHCPTNLFAAAASMQTGKGKKQKEKYFSTLSGLSQHLESGACQGGKRAFMQCIELIQGRLEQFGFGGMRVLLPSAENNCTT